MKAVSLKVSRNIFNMYKCHAGATGASGQPGPRGPKGDPGELRIFSIQEGCNHELLEGSRQLKKKNQYYVRTNVIQGIRNPRV